MTSQAKSTTNKAVLSMKTQVLGDNLLPTVKKKVAVHSKNPYRAKKSNPFKKIVRPDRTLDGFYLLERSKCEFPHEVISISLTSTKTPFIIFRNRQFFKIRTSLKL